MQTLIWNNLTETEQQQYLARPAQVVGESIKAAVNEIKANVIANGDKALFELAEKFDKVKLESLVVSEQQIQQAQSRISPELKQAIQNAKANIEAFHKAQQNQEVDIETQPGVCCQVITRPINAVGLYIPGGSAPLFSTVLMLAVRQKLPVVTRLCFAHHRRLPMKFSTPPICVGWKRFTQLGGLKRLLRWQMAHKR